MKIDPAGYPFVAGTILPAALCLVAGWTVAAVVLFAGAAAMLFFFRDPERRSPADADAVISPADGRVVVAGPPQPAVAPAGSWQQISIFLSPLDVHVNRIPLAGKVTHVEYRPGKFLAAYRGEAATENERNEIWVDHGGTLVAFRQVTGVLVRRVVCRLRAGDEVQAGQRFGVMKFGSRIDLFLPPSARLLVEAGARVRAGETIIARLS
jgi:phosphatidylserine decarboxylase